jgi:hypothetical protein
MLKWTIEVVLYRKENKKDEKIFNPNKVTSRDFFLF